MTYICQEELGPTYNSKFQLDSYFQPIYIEFESDCINIFQKNGPWKDYQGKTIKKSKKIGIPCDNEPIILDKNGIAYDYNSQVLEFKWIDKFVLRLYENEIVINYKSEKNQAVYN